MRERERESRPVSNDSRPLMNACVRVVHHEFIAAASKWKLKCKWWVSNVETGSYAYFYCQLPGYFIHLPNKCFTMATITKNMALVDPMNMHLLKCTAGLRLKIIVNNNRSNSSNSGTHTQKMAVAAVWLSGNSHNIISTFIILTANWIQSLFHLL